MSPTIDHSDKAAKAWMPQEWVQAIDEHEDGNFLNVVEAVEDVSRRVPTAEAACAQRSVLLEADTLLTRIATCDALHLPMLHLIISLCHE